VRQLKKAGAALSMPCLNEVLNKTKHTMKTEQHPEKKIAEEGAEIIRFDKTALKEHFGEFVRGTVEETLNALLDAEADELCGAARYERNAERTGYRAGSYRRKLHTRAGELDLKVPKLRNAPFETQIIERYRRRESGVEEALVEMYLAGVSVRRVEDITQALWGTRVSASTVSELNQKIYGKIEEWRRRPLEGEYPYVYLDGIWLKRSWGGETRQVSVLVAMAVNAHGYREIIGAAEGMKEDKESWLGFLRSLKERGLRGTRLVVSDCCAGLVESLGEVFSGISWQRCTVHFMRNVWSKVPKAKVGMVAGMLKALYAQEDIKAARAKVVDIEAKLRAMKLGAGADVFAAGVEDTLTFMKYPSKHRRSLHSNNPLERIMKEIRRRTRVVGAFPDGRSALMLVCARLRHIAATKWGEKRYLDMGHLHEQEAAEKEGEAA